MKILNLKNDSIQEIHVADLSDTTIIKEHRKLTIDWMLNVSINYEFFVRQDPRRSGPR